jgi:hypothetical protein
LGSLWSLSSIDFPLAILLAFKKWDSIVGKHWTIFKMHMCCKIYKAWSKSKWQTCFYLWKWNAHYLHYTCIEKWFIWLYFLISLINKWWICCAKKHIQNQDFHQNISSRIGDAQNQLNYDWCVLDYFIINVLKVHCAFEFWQWKGGSLYYIYKC